MPARTGAITAGLSNAVVVISPQPGKSRRQGRKDAVSVSARDPNLPAFGFAAIE
jgi:hypothetical protein